MWCRTGTLLLSVLIGVSCLFSQEPSETHLAAERDRLLENARSLYLGEKSAEASAEGLKAIVIQRRLPSQDVARSLENLDLVARICEAAGKWDDSSTLRSEAHQIATDHLGAAHWRTLDTKFAITKLDRIRRLGDAEQAELKQADDLAPQIVSLFNSDKRKEAAVLARRVVEIQERLLGTDHPEFALGLLNLAAQLDPHQDRVEVESLHIRALQIASSAYRSPHPVTAAISSNLGVLYVNQGRYAEAEKRFEQALEIRKSALGMDHRETALSFTNVGHVKEYQGDYLSSEEPLRQALAIHERVSGRDSPETAASLSHLAGILMIQSRFYEAEPLLQRALSITETLGDSQHRIAAHCVGMLGKLEMGQRRFDEATVHFRREVERLERALGRGCRELVGPLNNLANSLSGGGDYAQAEEVYDRALSIANDRYGVRHPLTWTTQTNRGNLDVKRGLYDRAQDRLNGVLEQRRAVWGAIHPELVHSYRVLGRLAFQRGQMREAKRLLSLGLESSGGDPVQHRFESAFSDLGYISWRLGDVDAARQFASEAIRTSLHVLEQAAVVQSEEQQFTASLRAYNAISLVLTIEAGHSASTAQTWDSVLAWKGFVSGRQLHMRASMQSSPEFAQYRAAAGRLSAHLLHPPVPSASENLDVWKRREPTLRKTWESRRSELTDECHRLERALTRASHPYRQALDERTVFSAGILKSLAGLGEPTALIDFVEYWHLSSDSDAMERRLTAFVARGDRKTIDRVDLGPTEPFDRQLQEWGKTDGDGKAGKAAALFLREQLWLPLAKHLGDIRTVLISPDGVLGQLPFGALPGEDNNSFLIERYGFVTIPIPRMLPGLLAVPPRADSVPDSLLLVGDVEYGADPGMTDLGSADSERRSLRSGNSKRFDRLAAAKEEIASIQKVYQRRRSENGVHVLTEARASESAFRREAPRHQWLHLVTHGFYEPDPGSRKRAIQVLPSDDDIIQPVLLGLQSGLAFAGANLPYQEDRDDGILTAFEVMATDLSNVEVAVLAACESGLGAETRGEGLLGLQRAFQIAGTRTVLATLWEVKDRKTQVLIQQFYEKVWAKKLSRLEAIRQAQIGMLRDPSTPTGFLPPHFWGAFVLSGDWR